VASGLPVAGRIVERLSHIRRLRAKSGDDVPVITPVRGVGYRIDNLTRPAVHE
jgi:DNA-binding response OmpR family regulator